MKTAEEVDALMERIPERSRTRWCLNGRCACLGCVQVCCRTVMAEEFLGRRVHGDPENIDEGKIPVEFREKFRPTYEEWVAWMRRKRPPGKYPDFEHMTDYVPPALR